MKDNFLSCLSHFCRPVKEEILPTLEDISLNGVREDGMSQIDILPMVILSKVTNLIKPKDLISLQSRPTRQSPLD